MASGMTGFVTQDSANNAHAYDQKSHAQRCQIKKPRRELASEYTCLIDF